MSNWENHWVDYYKILEVSRNANFNQIKKKYRKLMRKYHPDNYRGEDIAKMAQLINEAYGVLSNPEKRKAYDLEYNRRLASDTSNTTSQSMEEDMKHYTEEEQKFAKAVALKSIVEKELEKATIVIDAKNEIIYSAYDVGVDKFAYYKNVKEFVTMANEYDKELYDLCDLCYKYELFSEIEAINEVIVFLEENIKDIPLSPREAIRFMEEESRKEKLLSMCKKKTEEVEEAIQDIETLFQNVHLRQISHIQYNQFSEKVLINAQEVISTGKQLILLLTKNHLENTDLETILGKLGALVKTWPEDYEAASKVGKYILTKTNLTVILSQYEEYTKKMQKIIGVIKRHPTNHHVKLLYNHAKKLSKEITKKLQEALQQNQVEQSIQDIVDKAYLLSEEAKQIYTDANEQSKKADIIYSTREKYTYTNKEIEALLKEATSQFDKGKSLELLKEAGYYLHTLEEINILHNDWIKQIRLLKSDMEKVNQYDVEIDKMMEIIQEIIGNYQSIMEFDVSTLKEKDMNTSFLESLFVWLVFTLLEGIAATLCNFEEVLPLLVILTGVIVVSSDYDARSSINSYQQKKEEYCKKYIDLKEGRIL